MAADKVHLAGTKTGFVRVDCAAILQQSDHEELHYHFIKAELTLLRAADPFAVIYMFEYHDVSVIGRHQLKIFSSSEQPKRRK